MQKTARPAKGAPFFCTASKQRKTFVVKQSVQHAPRIYQAAGKKIPAFRRANDTLFNVSERSAR
ncbi:hypothetical protein [Paraburkholderia caffeinilytica]|uniref:hypothetical protein n=1 Tax=Paraburkholderia caffeinilytica TaxID=1761016 RepID=UPI0038B9E7E2